MPGIIYKIIKDASKSVYYNVKSYAFLSVTIIITFSALGIYMFYSDSDIYNKYKDTMKVSSKIAVAEYEAKDAKAINLIKKRIDENKNSKYYTSVELPSTDMSSFWRIPSSNIMVDIHIVPNYVWAYYYDITDRAESVEGKKNFTLNKNEIIICESLYKTLKNREDKEGKLYVKLPVMRDDGTSELVQFYVKDVCKDKHGQGVTEYKEDGLLVGYYDIFVSADLYSKNIYNNYPMKLSVYSDNVKEIVYMASELNIYMRATVEEKEEMNSIIINSIYNRRIIVIGLLFLLGINLFSCFLNALNERKFEVGIKRAVGARKGEIVFQFFIEGMIVMMIDILISSVCIMAVMSAAKLYYFYFERVNWIIRVTGYSIVLFAICSIFLSVFFSVAFAIMSTRVEIVKYLKGE